MKANVRAVLALAAMSGVVGSTDVNLNEKAATNKDIEQDDAEFWERFLGYYYKPMKKQPTRAPVPMSMPTDPPTPSPTPNPTDPPTREPTDPPTPEPTNPPTREPTDPPTPAPTSPPTPQEFCITTIDVVCNLPTADGGIPCDQNIIESARCNMGDVIDSVSFTFLGPRTCNTDSNSQPDQAICTDLGDIPNGAVSITCTDLFDVPLDVYTRTESNGNSVDINEEFFVQAAGGTIHC